MIFSNLKRTTCTFLLTIFVIFLNAVFSFGQESKDQKLWYKQPANSWMKEALPIGNGYLGAMLFGGVEEEHIQFNEETLWTGGKGEWNEYNGGNKEGAHKHLLEVRRLLDLGKYEEAHQLANRELTGVIKADKGNSEWEGYGAYQPFGDLYVRPESSGTVSNYRRELNIDKGVASVEYMNDGVHHKREYFANYPSRTLVFRFHNDKPEGIDYVLRQTTEHKNVDMAFKGGQLIMSGYLENNGMGFESRLVVESDGKILPFIDGKLTVKAANTLTLYLTASTDYINEYPHYSGRKYKELNKKTIEIVLCKGYDVLLSEHITDYSNLFSRVNFTLDGADKDNLPTDERLRLYANGEEDHTLESLYFQYGRYLLISSSRPGTMPANLQGKWNNMGNPPWASDYHANINIQMIYWPAEVTNLSECHEPLIEYIDRLRPPGRKSAKDFFNADGWIVNTMNNPFGYTAPGWGFPWGFFPGGAAWYGRHVWEHYEFSGDRKYLKVKGYPIMKEAAQFWLDYLTKDKDGFLVSSPSYSPEHGGISTGAYMDIEIAWDIFTNSIKACEELGVDNRFKEKLAAAKSKLLPLKIGKWGQLQEWKEDVDDPTNKHRHVSHLYALYPGTQVNTVRTPDLVDAARVSLNARGDDGTGWSIGWKINFWARLLDGDRSYKLLNRAMQLTQVDGVNMVDGGGVYNNLFSTHPPFQLDGNMGATAGMAEMLLQSHSGEIHILPAVPKAWPTGKISGLKARGGIEVDIEWSHGKLNKLVLKSDHNQTVKIRYHKEVIRFDLNAGKVLNLDGSLGKY
ncbi:glycoside hydrolase N-terminal domain-containing protein [Arenibacter sp. BSSL-BM3]|uniref:Glycoside hydrolase N-terminal domain-containing protein n=1 Tax=Arenibacter arenosicollis TaxID=2762274 RepID=A0ABR7QPJ4_9FLAO|nr:glycoside hydrolase family 95 protein [Arenibacter arenosicollis]MBC8769103.1 glycoside hydrolase N-terminal domain-containing protein [Arenibacter arenosicollis]